MIDTILITISLILLYSFVGVGVIELGIRFTPMGKLEGIDEKCASIIFWPFLLMGLLVYGFVQLVAKMYDQIAIFWNWVFRKIFRHG